MYFMFNYIFIGFMLFANYANGNETKNFHKMDIDEYQEMTCQMTQNWIQCPFVVGKLIDDESHYLQEIVTLSFPNTPQRHFIENPLTEQMAKQIIFYATDEEGIRYSLTAEPLSQDHADLSEYVNIIAEVLKGCPAIRQLEVIFYNNEVNEKVLGINWKKNNKRYTVYFFKRKNFLYALQTIITDDIFRESYYNSMEPDSGFFNKTTKHEIKISKFFNSFIINPEDYS